SITYRIPGTVNDVSATFVASTILRVPGVSRPAARCVPSPCPVCRPLLPGRRQPGIQREDLGIGEPQRVQRIPGVADLPLTGEKNQDVARTGTAQLSHRVTDRLGLIAVIGIVHGLRTVGAVP